MRGGMGCGAGHRTSRQHPVQGGSAVEIATGLKEPRGLVWDRDYTVFVADQAQSAVFSFPSGRSMRNAPLTKAVEFSAAYGVALLSDEDCVVTFQLCGGISAGPAVHGQPQMRQIRMYSSRVP